jgi:hypothetical protein
VQDISDENFTQNHIDLLKDLMISAINEKNKKRDYVMVFIAKPVNYENYGLSKLKYLYSDKSKMKKELT